LERCPSKGRPLNRRGKGGAVAPSVPSTGEKDSFEEIGSLQNDKPARERERAWQQNKQLFNELNESRVREAQTHLIK